MAYKYTYYEQVQFKEAFAEHATGSPNFEDFRKEKNAAAVSSWGRKGLIACRVLCEEEQFDLPLLTSALSLLTKKHMRSQFPGLRHLIDGHHERQITTMPEGAIIQQEPAKFVGSVWAAFRPFLAGPSGTRGATDLRAAPRPVRQTSIPDRYGDFVNSQHYEFGSSQSSDPSSHDSHASVGFVGKPVMGPVEEASLLLIKSFIKCVLVHGQSPDLALQGEVRHQSLACTGRTEAKSIRIDATDDGGVQLFQNHRSKPHVAAIEAKRDLEKVVDGRPMVSDLALAQIVGEALALMLDEDVDSVSTSDFVTILAAGKYIKFFHMNITDELVMALEGPPVDSDRDTTLEDAPADSDNDAAMENLLSDVDNSADSGDSPSDGDTPFLNVSSSVWFDLGDDNGRLHVARHIIGLTKWANVEYANKAARFEVDPTSRVRCVGLDS